MNTPKKKTSLLSCFAVKGISAWSSSFSKAPCQSSMRTMLDSTSSTRSGSSAKLPVKQHCCSRTSNSFHAALTDSFCRPLFCSIEARQHISPGRLAQSTGERKAFTSSRWPLYALLRTTSDRMPTRKAWQRELRWQVLFASP